MNLRSSVDDLLGPPAQHSFRDIIAKGRADPIGVKDIVVLRYDLRGTADARCGLRAVGTFFISS